MDRSYYDKYQWAEEQYLPFSGEGETMATQTVTAVTKLVFKWYNDGDVYDTTHHLQGWANDLSSYANWLYVNIPCVRDILNRIETIDIEEQYEQLLADITDVTHTQEYLAKLNQKPKVGTIYECDGPFHFEEESDEYHLWPDEYYDDDDDE